MPPPDAISAPAAATAAAAGPPRLIEGRPAERLALALVGAAMAANAVLVAGIPSYRSDVSPAGAAEIAFFLTTLIAGTVLVWLARQPDSWAGVRWLALGFGISLGFQLAGWVGRGINGRPEVGRLLPLGMAAPLLGMLVATSVDFLEHVGDRRTEVLSDIAMVAILTGAGVFLLLQPQPDATASTWSLALTALLAVAAVVVVAGWSVLCMWCPTGVHLGLLLTGTAAAGSALALDHVRLSGSGTSAMAAPELLAAMALLAMTAILVVEPSLNRSGPRQPHGKEWLRPALLGISLGGACLIVALSLLSPASRLSAWQSVTLAGVVFGAVGLRMVMNQLTMERSARQLAVALEQREEAMASIRQASEAVSTSEARLRLLLGAAADGIVELDGFGTVVRANRAFCSWVRLAEAKVVGRRWGEMVELAGAGPSLAELPKTGWAVLVLPGETLHLEARTSRLSGNPPGRLLLIRDVTASKASEQTIRTLLNFLQDRDEDRTRLLKRTNAAIETERNRMARDLHDGPIQGISAVALSLEALRLMLEAGDTPRGIRTLKEISGELSEEAMNLRRIMSGLRPPVLEERGLIPAVSELCSRLERETGVVVKLTGDPNFSLSRDVETLAYRVVQEALSNVSKHSGASRVTVRIEVGAGTLQVVVVDNGWGFEAEASREFLRAGKVGLASMRERTELAGGSFSIRSGPGTGTVVMAAIPFDVLTNGNPLTDADDQTLAGLPEQSSPSGESLAEFTSRMQSTAPTGSRAMGVGDGARAAGRPRQPGPALGEGDSVGLSEGDGDSVGLSEGDGLSEGRGLSGVSEGVSDGEGDSEGLAEGDAVTERSGMTS